MSNISNALARMVMPTLERNIATELSRASSMVDNMLAPTAHAYVKKHAVGNSTFGGTRVVMEKVSFLKNFCIIKLKINSIN